MSWGGRSALSPTGARRSFNDGRRRLLTERSFDTPSSPYLTVEDVAARLRCSTRSVHEWTRLGEIPHRRLPGQRRCLFLLAELEAWEDGAKLETVDLARGGRIVRPLGSPAGRAARGR